MAKIPFIKESKGSIVQVATGKALHFQHNPESISDSKSPNVANITVPGFSHQKHHYVSGGARTISFDLKIAYDGTDVNKVKNQVNWLMSLCYPEYDNKGFMKYSNSEVILNFGDTYKNKRCIVKSVGVKYTNWFEPRKLIPLEATVSIKLEEDSDTAISSSSIERGV